MLNCLVGSFILTSQAQTTWVGGPTDHVGDASNWDPANLPTNSGNVGTINSDALWERSTDGGNDTLTNYYINITGGTLDTTTAFLNTYEYDGGALSVNGGAFNMRKNLSLGSNNASTLTVNSGSATIVGGFDIRTAAVEINGGTFNANNNVALINSGTSSFTVNGGTVNLSGSHTFGTPNFSSGGAAYFNGGTITGGATLNYRHAWTLTLGGSTAGSATFSNFGGSNHNNSNIGMDWLTGSLMSLTITGAADWGETYWDSGQITFDGDDFSTLGNWATVNGTIFDWDGGTNTLSLVPEPSAYALMAGLIGLGVVVSRRRRP